MKLLAFSAITLSLLSLAPPAQAKGKDKTASSSILCAEIHSEELGSWKVHFKNGAISTEGFIHSVDDSAVIKLKKSGYPENKPFPYGIYKGTTSKNEEFELLIYGLNMFESEGNHKVYIARVRVGAEIMEETSCRSPE